MDEFEGLSVKFNLDRKNTQTSSNSNLSENQTQKTTQVSEICFKNIMDICENHILGQTKSVQEIVSLCSKITGYEFYCNQIVAFCNQIFAETLNSSHTIIKLCKSFTDIDLAKEASVNISDTQSLTLKHPAETNIRVKTVQPSTSTDSCVPKKCSDISSVSAINELKDEISPGTKNLKKKPRKSFPVKLSNAKIKKVPDLESSHHDTEDFLEVDDKIDSDDEDEDDDHDQGESQESDDPEFKPKEKITRRTIHKCSICEKTYKTKKMFIKHMEGHGVSVEDLKFEKKDRVNRLSSKIPVTAEELTCEYCGRLTVTKKALTEHIRTHTGEKPYICELCGKGFAQSGSLKSHQLIHIGTKSVACELCDYTCLSKRRLKLHMVCHSSEKKYQCAECGNRYARSTSLNIHMNSHTGAKPHACDQCDKRFARRSHMVQHRKIHTEEMPYSCEICGKRSHQPYNIVVHMRTHTGHKPFSCEKCGKQFAHNVSLRQHKINCTERIDTEAVTNFLSMT
ncbi:zinc finger protein 37 homolog [Patella vulgata]|uniref:zinc finger protein 37 homolog n=1 Tax=Patella vulgata TaxID=6465 RepID=UPI0021801F13|nr:zinc finger protein 37 homolog [Patella vulgata]XP_050417549.1 zinc finger protein 37 homolog [Patella vulgata]XP_050417550.1 zinc finger protein 37 homolog [Patella vulgata]